MNNITPVGWIKQSGSGIVAPAIIVAGCAALHPAYNGAT
jgi:hypothetical protein